MPTPFDHLPQFQSLSPEAKEKVTTKFAELPEEDKQTIMGKINTPMSVRDADPGLQETPTLLSKSDFTPEKIETLAVDLTNVGIPPHWAALAAKTFQVLPDIVTAAPVLKGAKMAGTAAKAGLQAAGETALGQAFRKTGLREAEAVGEKIAQLGVQETKQMGALKTAQEAISRTTQQVRNQIMEETSKPILATKEAIKKLPAYKQRIMQEAEERLLQAKAAIGKAEADIGVDMTKVGTAQFGKFIDTPRHVKNFSQKFFKVANEIGEDRLAEAASPQYLQTIRKAAENAAKDIKNVAYKNELFAIEKTFRNALTKSNKTLQSAVKNFKSASEAVKTLPAEFEATKNTINLSLQRFQNIAKEKIMTDPRLKQLGKAIEIMERRVAEVPRKYANQRAQLELALTKAKNLASRQTMLRWTTGATAGAAAAVTGVSAAKKVAGQ